ncbi:MAG TPA: hypothetical protein DCX22_04460 [Dehalococcoidia bacterium]|nr:hypothetical protein [Dehalococcoidia bacterium]
MQSLYDHLTQSGIKAELQQEPAYNSLSMSVLESVIEFHEQALNKLRLVSTDYGGCGTSENILRFQYEMYIDKGFSWDQAKDLNAITQVIKEGKIMNLFGGKPAGIKWAGKKLAETLNHDQSIIDDLMKCIKAWNYIEFQIKAVPPSDVYIIGPQFTNPEMIAKLYKHETKEDIHCCIFGYTIVEKIAKHIRTINF